MDAEQFHKKDDILRFSLEPIKWKEFIVSDYFYMTSGRESNMDGLKQGKIPLISAKKINNGLKGFVSANEIKQGGVITWNKDGDGGAGLAYYQPFDFAADSHIMVLTPKIFMSQNICLFIKTSLSQYYGIFGHGRANSERRAARAKIILPVKTDGQPDWDFMEQFIKERYENMIDEYNQDIRIKVQK
jgi:hypothetical protein